MSQPAPFNRSFNFSNFQAQNPNAPLPAGPLDEEFSRVKAVLDQIRSSIKAIQRDDTALANNSVGRDQLKPEVAVGLNPPTIWASATNYVARDTVITGQIFYMCSSSHVSGVFEDDLAAAKWTLLADFTAVGTPSAALTSYDNSTSGLTAANVQDAIDEIVGDIAEPTISGGTINGAAIGGSVPSTGRFISVAIGSEMLSPIPVGFIGEYGGASAPAKWLLCYGQAVSRVAYAALFTAIDTIHGVGDGATTFNLPDYRGRVGAGQDDMGGVSANRLTGLSGGVDGDTLGGTGGLETHTLTAAQLAAHTHTGPSHTHTFSDTSSNGSTNHAHGGIPLSGVTGSAQTAVQGGAANGGSTFTGDSGSLHTHTVSGTTSAAGTGATGSAGSGAAHNNVQPTIILNKIIYAGV